MSRRLVLALAIAAGLASSPGQADILSPHAAALDRWTPFVAEAAQRFGIPPAWIRAVIAAESGGRTHRDGVPIRSPAGAIGLMQLMPGTFETMRVRHGLGADPQHPRDNILAGTAYLREHYDRFGRVGVFAAYHAGPGRYRAHLSDGRPLPAETMAYLVAVETLLGAAAAPLFTPRNAAEFLLAAPDANRRLFVIRDGLPVAPASHRLFVPLSGNRR